MWRLLLFFALLYFIQGAALAYVINFQKPFLSGQGISKETLGMFTALLLVPFIIKVFLGMLSDRVPIGAWGSRKPYMAIGMMIFAFCYLGLGHLDPQLGFLPFACLTWLASLGLALFDTCADGWAIDVAEEKDQSLIQASMVAGKSLGLITMSFLFGIMAEQAGYGVIFKTLSALSLVVLIVILLVPYRPRSPSGNEIKIGVGLNCFEDFIYSLPFLASFISVASFGTDGLVTLHLADVAKANPYDIGVYGMLKGLGAFIGAGLYALASARSG